MDNLEQRMRVNETRERRLAVEVGSDVRVGDFLDEKLETGSRIELRRDAR